MFKQIKSAIFWTLVYKFRRRLSFVVVLLSIAVFSNLIYSDVVQYLELKEKIDYLDYILPLKWFVVFSCIGTSVYLVLTIFKQEKELSKKNKPKFFKSNKNSSTKETKTNESIEKEEEFSEREKKFLKKKLRSRAEILLDKK